MERNGRERSGVGDGRDPGESAPKPNPESRVAHVYLVATALDEHVFLAAEEQALAAAGFATTRVRLGALFEQGEVWARVLRSGREPTRTGQDPAQQQAQPRTQAAATPADVPGPDDAAPARRQPWSAGLVVFFPISRAEQVACAAVAGALAAHGHDGWRVSAQAQFWPTPAALLRHASGLHGAVMLRPASALLALTQSLAESRRPAGLAGAAWRMTQADPDRPDEVLYWPLSSQPAPPARPSPERTPRYLGLRAAPVLMSAGCAGECPGCTAGAALRHGWEQRLWAAGVGASHAAEAGRGASILAVHSPNPFGAELRLEPDWPETFVHTAEQHSPKPLMAVKMLSDEVDDAALARLARLDVTRVILRHRLRLPRFRLPDDDTTSGRSQVSDDGPWLAHALGSEGLRNQVLQQALAQLTAQPIAVEVHLLGWESAPPLSELAETLMLLRQAGPAVPVASPSAPDQTPVRSEPVPFRLHWLPHLANSSFIDGARIEPPMIRNAAATRAHSPQFGALFLARLSLAWAEVFHRRGGLAHDLAEVRFLRRALTRLAQRMGRTALTEAEERALDECTWAAGSTLLGTLEALVERAQHQPLSLTDMVEAGRDLCAPEATAELVAGWSILRQAGQRLAGRTSLIHDGLRWTSSGH